MLKLAGGALAAGWALLLLIALTGQLSWSNKLLWAPPALFALGSFVGLSGLNHEAQRAPLLIVGALAFCSALGYAVFYFFLFGLSGH